MQKKKKQSSERVKSMRSLKNLLCCWFLKELLRIYKLSLLLNEYGDPSILFQTSSSLSFTKFPLQFLFQKNDLVILAVLICDASL